MYGSFFVLKKMGDVMKKDISGIILVLWMFLVIAFVGKYEESHSDGYIAKQESLRHEDPYTQELVRLENGQIRISANKGQTFSRKILWLLLACFVVWESWKTSFRSCYWRVIFLLEEWKKHARVRKRRGPPFVEIV